jgi:thermolabile hemolysin
VLINTFFPVKQRLLAAGLALLAFVVAVWIHSLQSAPSVRNLYVFGDSLSDTGNVFESTQGAQPPNPPYYQGRYSNGPVWVEYLAADLALQQQQITNTAYGGATTGSDRNNGVPSVLTQVQQVSKTQLNPQDLYILWAGANDYLTGTTNPTIPVENLSKAITTLVNTGARKILVANLPDLGNLPATRNEPYAKALSSITSAHNQALAKVLQQLEQQTQAKILTLDTHKLYEEAIKNPAKFGFTNVTSACVNGSAICQNPDQFLFWDGIHPTAATHRILGEQAFAAFETQVSRH